MPPPRQRDLFVRPARERGRRTRAVTPTPGQRLARGLRRRGGVGVLVLGACMAVMLLGGAALQPVYRGTATVALAPQGGTAADPGVALQTQAQELGSREVVAEAAALAGSGLELHWLRPELTARLRRARRTDGEQLAVAARRQLRITPVADSRIIELECTAPSPRLAIGFLRALLERERARLETAQAGQARAEAANWQRQAQAAQQQLQVAQAALTELARAQGLADPAAQLAAAEQRWQSLAAASSLTEQTAWQQTSQLQAGIALQPPAAIELQRTTLAARIARLSAQYLPQAAPLVEARQEMAGLDAAWRQAQAQARLAAEASLAAVHSQQSELEAALRRAAAQKANLQEIVERLDMTQRQLAAAQAVYTQSLERWGEATNAAGDFRLPWRLVDAPHAWPQPERPRRASLAGAGLALGLALALGAMAAAEWRDDRLRLPEAAELGPPLLAACPAAGPAGGVEAGKAGLERCAAALLRAQSENGASVVLITSLEEGAGKTGVARGLAAALATMAPVLLLEGNLRRPALHCGAHARETVAAAPGLVELLREQITVEQALHAGAAGTPSRICGGDSAGGGQLLLALAGGAIAELLTAARQRHDWVIVDGAALRDGPEAELWAGLCDCTVFVVRHGVTSRREARRGCDALEEAGVGSLGLVLTGVPEGLAARARLEWFGSSTATAAIEIAGWQQRAG